MDNVPESYEFETSAINFLLLYPEHTILLSELYYMTTNHVDFDPEGISPSNKSFSSNSPTAGQNR